MDRQMAKYIDGYMDEQIDGQIETFQHKTSIKSMALKLQDKRTLTLVDRQTDGQKHYYTKHPYKVLDYKDAQLIAHNLVLCCPRNQYYKNQINRIITSHKNLLLKVKINMFKMDMRHSG